MSREPAGLLLFDAAGTLIEPAEPVETVYRRHFAAHGWETDETVIRAGFRKTFAGLADPNFAGTADGDGAERSWWRNVVELTAVSAGIDPAERNFDGCFEDLFGHYAAGSAWRLFPETREVLGRLRAAGFRTAVVSNFDRRLHRVLAELGLVGSFDLILTSADVRARKPSPALLESAIGKLGGRPETSFFTGDSKAADQAAAECADVPFFLLERPSTTLVDFEKWVVENFFTK